jgi:hypothetical protein
MQNPGAIVAQHDRICELGPATCATAACGPSLAPSFTTCLLAAGNQICPANVPTRHAVGSPVLACGSCSCMATISCAGTMALYSQGGCNGTAIDVPMGMCVPVNSGQAVRSYNWMPSASASSTCEVTGPQGASVTLANESTVCCP